MASESNQKEYCHLNSHLNPIFTSAHYMHNILTLMWQLDMEGKDFIFALIVNHFKIFL